MLYHTDKNVLLGAPTGSGKTISAELAMLHLFNTQPDMKVYPTCSVVLNLVLYYFFPFPFKNWMLIFAQFNHGCI